MLIFPWFHTLLICKLQRDGSCGILVDSFICKITSYFGTLLVLLAYQGTYFDMKKTKPTAAKIVTDCW